MASPERPKAPGLKWRRRKGQPDVPYWFASPKAVDAGYPLASVNLRTLPADKIADACRQHQLDMLQWLGDRHRGLKEFNGTWRSLLTLYQTDPDSSFHDNKPGTIELYTIYLRKLIDHIGAVRIDQCDGRDVKRWFAVWRQGPPTKKHPDGRDQLPAARAALAVLKAAVTFGIICRYEGCAAFKAMLDEMEFDRPRRRTMAPTAEQIVAARLAAHVAGAPRRALTYAIQFETTLRQWDVIGVWVPMDDPRPSAMIRGKRKWIGLTWSAINDELILAKVRPTKTEDTTEVEISFDLAACPMVTEELAKIPLEQRKGPLIINERTGMPYDDESFYENWRKDFEAAKLPRELWNRDLRAGGVTEGGKAGASRDDRRLLAGHAREETTLIYDRDTVEAHRRTMQARKAFREKGEK